MRPDIKKLFCPSATSLVMILLLLSACGPIDPSMSGHTANCPEREWIAPRRVPKPCPFTECVSPEDCSPLLDACELLDIGLRNNPQTQQTWRSARAAAFNVGVAKAALYPDVEGAETLATSDTFGAGGSGGNATSSASGIVTGSRARFSGGKQWLTSDISLSYLLLDFGGRCATIAQARDALWAANWTHNRMVQTVMVNVLNTYYNYVYALGLRDAREQDMKDAEKSLDAAKAQFEAGVTTKVDLLQIQALYFNAKLQLETARGQVKTALGQLATAVGWPADSCIQIECLPLDLPLNAVSEDMCSLLTVAKDSRPDLASAYATYLESKAAVAVAESDALPTLTFAGDVQRTDVYQNPLLSGSSQSAAITLNVPIFTGWLYENQIASAKETACSAMAAWRSTELNVLLDVVTSYYAYTTAAESVSYSEEYLKFAQEAYDAALLGYRMGTNSILDVLNAQLTLSNARSQRIQTRTQLFTSIANMAYAVGTL